MKRMPRVAVCVFLSFLWVPLVSAAPNNGPVPQKQQAQVPASSEFGQIIRPRAGISWKERVMKQREIQKRAEARRKVLLQQAERERQQNPQPAPVPPPM